MWNKVCDIPRHPKTSHICGPRIYLASDAENSPLLSVRGLYLFYSFADPSESAELPPSTRRPATYLASSTAYKLWALDS